MKASPPPRQAERLASLRDLEILDTPRERDFDEIVELASRICNTPISVINLIDEHRQWFKAETGLGVRETPLDTSICADTLADPRMADNPLCTGEPHLRFYAGALLKTDDGYPIGTLCVLDHQPRDLTDLQRFALQVLSRQVMTQIKLRRTARMERAARLIADEKIDALHIAAANQDILLREIDHRVKNSLNVVAAMLNIQARVAATEGAGAELSTARDRVLAIAAIHDQLHDSAHYDRVDMPAFMNRLVESLRKSLPDNVTMRHETKPLQVETNIATSVGIIVNELVTNALKHGFPDARPGEITIRVDSGQGRMDLEVSDGGIGLRVEGAQPARQGLGTRVVRSSVEQLGGTLVYFDNTPGVRVAISLPTEPS